MLRELESQILKMQTAGQSGKPRHTLIPSLTLSQNLVSAENLTSDDNQLFSFKNTLNHAHQKSSAKLSGITEEDRII